MLRQVMFWPYTVCTLLVRVSVTATYNVDYFTSLSLHIFMGSQVDLKSTMVAGLDTSLEQRGWLVRLGSERGSC